MRLLDGSPELTVLVLTLARTFGRSPVPLEGLRETIWAVAKPSPGGLDRARYDRLFIEGLTRCGYLASEDGDGPFRLTDRAFDYFTSYEEASCRALNALASEVGIATPFQESDTAPTAEGPPQDPSLFAVTPELLRAVLTESGLPAELLEHALDAYRAGSVYLAADGGAYKLVLRTGP